MCFNPSPFELHEVFVDRGVPTITYVKPSEFLRLKSALKAPGQGIVIEGPSGIGKTTALKKCLEELGKGTDIKILSARKTTDVVAIKKYLSEEDASDLYIDDFHRLDDDLKAQIADLQKLRADEQSEDGKIVLIGINDAGKSLIRSSSDVANRIKRIQVSKQDKKSIWELIRKGETALNIEIECAEEIVEACDGSFYVAQLLCYEACLQANIESTQKELVKVSAAYAAIKETYLSSQKDRFWSDLIAFARGKKFRRTGRAPYFSVLRWFGESAAESINLREEVKKHPNEKGSVGQILSKGHLAHFCEQFPYSNLFHFDRQTGIFAVEDPQLRFLLKNINWHDFYVEVGFNQADNEKLPYDFALSFAGKKCRTVARVISEALGEAGHTVFFDEDAQEELLGLDLRQTLREKYKQAYVILPVIDNEYGTSVWTEHERSAYYDSLGSGRVVPIWVDRTGASGFDKAQEVGGINLRTQENGEVPRESIEAQVDHLVSVLDREIPLGNKSL